MRLLVLNNLSSGGGSRPLYEFLRAISEDGLEYVVRCTDGTTRVESLLGDAADFDAVVVSGGDGTASSAIYALRGTDTPVLVLPGGTANLLCNNIDSPIDPPEFLEILKKFKSLKFDIGEIEFDDKARSGFMVIAGAGYDAQIMLDAAKLKQSLGEAAYFAAALAKLNPTVSHFTLRLDGRTVAADGIAVLLVNFGRISLDLSITPENNPVDGMFEVVILKTSNSVQLLPAMFAALLNREGGYRSRGNSLEIHLAREVYIESDPPLEIQYDGEPTGRTTPFKARVLPSAATLIVDASSPRIQSWSKG